MNKTINLLAFAVLALTGTAQGLSAQGVGVGLRAGFVGIGVEGALGLSENLVLRGGLGLTPFSLSSTVDDIDFDVELPDSWYNVGFDFYPSSSFRLGGGILFKSDGPKLTGKLEPGTVVDIGGRDFTAEEIGELNGTLVSGDKAPYALIGFGRHTDLGFGLFVDLGVALLGDPQIELDVSGGSFPDQVELRQRLDLEETRLEDDAGRYLSLWPFLSIGLRFGIS
jgi:hypothetical protein